MLAYLLRAYIPRALYDIQVLCKLPVLFLGGGYCGVFCWAVFAVTVALQYSPRGFLFALLGGVLRGQSGYTFCYEFTG